MSMFDVSRVSVDVGDSQISFETGKLAKQAGGAVVVQAGDTMVLCTATIGSLRDVDFLPLTVDVEERDVRRGQNPRLVLPSRGQIRREGDADRAHDRPADPPALPQGLALRDPAGRDPDVGRPGPPLRHPRHERRLRGAGDLPVPVAKHVGAVRVGKLDGDFVVNPPEETHEELELDLIVAGTDEAILMVEAGANGVTEAEILDALDIAHGEIKKLVAAMEELQQKAGKEKIKHEEPELDASPARPDPLRVRPGPGRRDRHRGQARALRGDRQGQGRGRRQVRARGRRRDGDRKAEVKAAFGAIEKDTIRKAIAVDKKRPDGRAQDEIRPIECEVDISPRVHGSALFTRGETQILSNVALGTTRMDMRIDTLGLQTTKRFLHHYNFPPFSVGEAGFMRGPKRRDIGHGALAERALVATVPDEESFPYVIRAVSETLESNGSSSMGSVCASSMALQAAGVPVSAPVAGVAMGLIKEGDDYIVLTDIAGVEDHLGDMDFKVAGTKDGITALQMDIKITGVTFEILEDALEQALKGRQFILGKMAEAIDGPREKLSKHAPAIESIKIDPEKIGAVIGKGGETIRALCEEFEAEIDVEDDGTVRIYAPTGDLVEACVARIDSMTQEAEVGDRYNSAKVVKTTTFGAFVELVKGTDGLLHISNVKPGERVDSVDDVLTAGEEIDVTVVEVDKERGRIGLRLSDDPSVAGKSPEELASVGSGDGGRSATAATAAVAVAASGGRAVASASAAARR